MPNKQLRTSIICSRGTYHLRYKSHGDTKMSQISLQTCDKTVAEHKRQEFINNHVSDRRDQMAVLEAQLARLKADDLESDLSIHNVWKTFMSSTKRKHIRDETLVSYVGFWESDDGLKKFLVKNGLKTLSDVTEAHASDYVTYMAGRSLSKATASKYITFFKKLWRVVAPTSENPWTNQHAQGVGLKIGKRPFSLDQQRAIIQGIYPYFGQRNYKRLSCEELESAKTEYHALHTILAYTGLRLVDGCQLTIEEVDFNRGVIELQPRKTKFRGDNPMYAKIGIHPTVGMVLRTMLGGRKSGFFLPYIAAEYERDKSSVSKHIQRQIVFSTGLDCSVKAPGRARAVAVYGAHSHRKALSDRMRESGVDIMIRMSILGHKDSRSETQDYSHVSDYESIEASSKSMPDILAETKRMVMAV